MSLTDALFDFVEGIVEIKFQVHVFLLDHDCPEHLMPPL